MMLRIKMENKTIVVFTLILVALCSRVCDSNVSLTKLFVSRRTVLPEGIRPAVLVVSHGKIENIFILTSDYEFNAIIQKYPNAECEDFGELILMPGVVDSHVHFSEPGRTESEGFWTGTRAAAADGVTTVIDMPLHSIPITTTVQSLKQKAAVAHNQSFIDVGFWGGVVPGNQNELKPLINAGVIGFKCFLIPVDTFEYVREEDVKKALSELQNTNAVLAFHAELEEGEIPPSPQDDPADYNTFLKTHPDIMEIKAIAKVIEWCKSYNVRCHIVHVSSAKALSLIREAKEKQMPLTVETCFHYLHIAAENIPRGATEFKCNPPIRNGANREQLWTAMKDRTLDMVVSDHSPFTDSLKETGNFLTAWAGINSLQFGLPLLWTEARNRNFTLYDVVRVLCSGPAKLSGFENRKGSLRIGMDADFVVWNPNEVIEVQRSTTFDKNKLNPYLGEKLFGKVYVTIVRGNVVYRNGKFSDQPMGQLLLRDTFLSEVFGVQLPKLFNTRAQPLLSVTHTTTSFVNTGKQSKKLGGTEI